MARRLTRARTNSSAEDRGEYHFPQRCLSTLVVVFALSTPTDATADRLDDLRETENVVEQAVDLMLRSEPRAALDKLNRQIERLAVKDIKDPALARLLVTRAALRLFAQDLAAAKSDLAAAIQANYYVSIPADFRTDRLSTLLERARDNTARPVWDIRGGPYGDRCAKALTVDFLFTALPPSNDTIFAWRRHGDSPYHELQLEVFDNIAAARLPLATDTSNAIEYFVKTTNRERMLVHSHGSPESPIRIPPCRGTPHPEDVISLPPPPKPARGYPRITAALQFGTSVGIASGTADLSYQQYSPRDPLGGEPSVYGPREYSCAVARWIYDQDQLPDSEESLQSTLLKLQAVEGLLPTGVSLLGTQMTPQSVARSYEPVYCSAHHPVKTGIGSAPLHISPEVGLMLSERLHVSVFSRLQLVTGSRVYRDERNRGYRGNVESLVNHVYSQNNPQGVRVRPPFAWSVGAKLRYFLSDSTKRLRVFVGAFGGYGTARLRVNMKFSNDRNGNSIPDDRESGYDLVDETSSFDEATNPCTPVWPYNHGCTPGDGTDSDNPGDIDRNLAIARSNTADRSPRIDTVGVGRGFLGATLGARYEFSKSFALVSEFQVGGWFGKNASLLFDLTLGPMLLF